MAITKIIGAIHPPASGGKYKVLKKTIEYIMNPSKTENGLYVGSINCFPENALQAMIETQSQYTWKSNKLGIHERLGYHITISFSPEERVSAETAFQVMQEFSEAFVNKNYEAVYAVHTDAEHMHGHLCFSSVNMNTGRKYRYEDGDWAKIIQPITDQICMKYGLHTLEMDTGINVETYDNVEQERRRKTYYERKKYQAEQKSKQHTYHKDSQEVYNWNDYLRFLLDDIILHSNTLNDFYTKLKESGVKTKVGKSRIYGDYIGLKAPGMEIFRKTYQLGKEYTLEAIQNRILISNKPLPSYQLSEDKQLILPLRYFTRIRRKDISSPYMKRYWAKLYRMGIKPRSAKLTYQDLQKSRKKAEAMERQLEFVLQYRISSFEDATKLLDKYKTIYGEQCATLEHIKKKHTPYDSMLRRYLWYIRLKKQKEQSIEWTQDSEEKLQLAQKAFEKYGVTEQEAEQYLKGKKQEEKEMSEKCEKALKDLKAIEQIAEEFATMKQMEYEEELEKEEKDFYETLKEDDYLQQDVKQKQRIL